MDRIVELDAVFDRVTGDPAVLGRGPDFVLYLVYDAITDAHFHIADELSDEVEVLNEEVLENPREREMVGRIAALRHRLAHLRRRLAPQREVLAALSRPGQSVVRERTVFYFRDVQDHVVRITEQLDVSRDLASQTMEIYLSTVNNRISSVMARMALVATIFLPLTFVTSVFGMNLPGNRSARRLVAGRSGRRSSCLRRCSCSSRGGAGSSVPRRRADRHGALPALGSLHLDVHRQEPPAPPRRW